MQVNTANKNQRGTILIIVMWVTLGMVSLALVFGNSMRLEYQAADNSAAGLQAEHAIEGVRRYVEYLLTNNETPGYLPNPEEIYEPEMIEVGGARAWLLGRDYSATNSETKPEFGLQDEAARLNINTATYDMLMNLPDMTEDLAAAIIDWRDENDEPRESGAESDYYLANDPSYEAKNADFESIEELKLINGAEWELLVGEDLNGNGLLDINENDGEESKPADDGNGILKPGLFDLVTVFSREPNKQEDGSERINFKQQNSRQELTQLFNEALGESRGNEIISAVGNTNNIQSVLQYYIRSGMTAEEFLEVYDALTISDDEYLPGLVNVSTAPKEVLACIPGIGDEYAAELVSQRASKAEDDLKTVGWVKDILPEENAIQAGPFLTARTFQFRADIAAVGKYGRGFKRVVFIIETGGEEMNVIHRKDLSRLGWPLGTDVREELRLEEWE